MISGAYDLRTGMISLRPRSNKFGAIPTVVDNIRFASMAEARRYSELKLLERAGEISRLELQPKFPMIVNGEKVTTYIADFAYFTKEKRVVEDVKSSATKTAVFRLKAKLLHALYPAIELTVIE
ncbi:MAG TPA: DUF1064 domain-containing protein [Candidatus Sulfotelmatobacter sp.]|nr:DUF1064 domain-containing protein [Candidatus Sulfotelmatobacter sp.]